jgi:hypothetical protein
MLVSAQSVQARHSNNMTLWDILATILICMAAIAVLGLIVAILLSKK